jgi:hypothetical protein
MAAQAYRELGLAMEADLNGHVYRKTDQSMISILL